MKKIVCCLFGLCICSTCFALDDTLYKKYKNVSDDANIIQAIEILEDTTGRYSKEAILGKNLTGKPIKVQFTNLGTINPMYANFDALGWKKKKTLKHLKNCI